MDNKPLIEQLYARLLGRTADAEGLSYWARVLDEGSAAVADLVAAFLASREFNSVILPVVQLYELAFQRQPDLDGLAYWAGQAQSGATLPQIRAAIAGSDEFHARFPGVIDPAATLAKLAQLAGAPGALDAQAYLLSFLPQVASGHTTGGGSTAIDVTAPVLVSSTPAAAAGNASRQVIELVFDEPVALGSGTIKITNGTTQTVLDHGVPVVRVVGATDERVLLGAGADGSVSVSGSILRISLDKMLTPGTSYSVVIGNGAVIDSAGNAFLGLQYAGALAFTTSSQTDFTAPSATSVTYTQSGAFGAGQVITLKLHFNEAVHVTGSPVLRMDPGAADRDAVYASGDGTSTLSFTYTVQAGDATTSFGLSSDLAAVRAGLAGTIADLAGNVLDGAHISFSTLSYAGYGYGTPLIELDTAGPAAPGAPFLASDTGVIGDNTTSNSTPAIRGMQAEAGSLVRLYATTDNGPVLLGDTTAGLDGSWTISPTLSHGSYQLFASVRDAALNTSLNSPFGTVIVDTVLPDTPSAPRMVVGDNTGATDDNVTSKANPEITGDAVETGATVYLYSGNGVIADSILLGQQAAGAGGSWTIVPAGLGTGVHQLFLVTRDAAGNLSAHSPITTLTIDSTAPAPPTITGLAAASDSGRLNNDQVTRLTNLRLSGTGALANGKIELFDGSDSLGLFDADATGAWVADVTIGTVQGVHQITAKTFSLSGTAGSLSAGYLITLDTAGPATAAGTPDLMQAYDSGSANDDNISNITTPHFSGTAPEAGALIELRTADDQLLGSATVGSNLQWEIVPTAALATDRAYQLTAYWFDLAGNRSVASPSLTYTLDRAGPEELFTQSGISPTAAITIPFDEAISWTTGDLVITSGSTETHLSRSQVTMGSDGHSIVLPANTFASGAEYTLSFPSTLTDLAGNAYSDGNIAFDFLAPALVSTTPASQGEFAGTISLTFNEAIAFANGGTIHLQKNGVQEDIYTFTKTSGNWEISNNTITFIGLSLNTGVYHLSLSNAIQDLVGNVNTDTLISSLPLILNKS